MRLANSCKGGLWQVWGCGGGSVGGAGRGGPAGRVGGMSSVGGWDPVDSGSSVWSEEKDGKGGEMSATVGRRR